MQLTREAIEPKTRKIIERIEAAEQWRDSNYKDLWQRCYKRWRNYVDPIIDPVTHKEIKDRSNISIPYTFTQVETILPRLVESLFASRPYVTVKGREPMDDGNAKHMETLLDWQMNERFDIQDKFHSGLKEMCIYGTCVAYVGWKYREREVTKKMQTQIYVPDPQNPDDVWMDFETGEPIPATDELGQPIMVWREQEVVEIEYDDPCVEFIDLGLFFVDPNATDIDDARYCGHTAYMTKRELDAMADNDEEIKIEWDKVPKDFQSNEARNERMSSVGLSAVENENTHDDEDRLYKVDFYFEDNRECIIINRAFKAKDAKNRYWHKRKPYVKDVYTDVPHEFYGMGVVEMLEDLQDELNVERNMRIDYRAMSMRRMWKVKKGSFAATQSLNWRQNGRIYVEQMDDEIEPLEAPDSALAGSFNQEQTIKQDMRDTSGAHDVVMGTGGGGNTATETMTKDNNAAIRFKLIISSIEKRLLVGVARMMMMLNQQFIDSERVMRVTGENGDEWIEVAPEDIQGEFDLIAAGSSVEPMANKEAYKQRMVEAFGIIANNPIMQRYPDKIIHMLKKVLESFDIKDTDSILPSDEQLMQGQLNQLMSMLPPDMNPPMMPQGGGANTAPMAEPGLRAVSGA